MKKKILAFLLACTLAVGMTVCPVGPMGVETVWAEDELTEGDWKYKSEGADGAIITKYTGSATELKIPKTIGGKKVIIIGDDAFRGCSNLTSIEIPENVTYIGWQAFSDCSRLTSINIPDGVTSIEDMVFEGCSSLANIVIPSSVTSIGHGAFGSSGLTSVSIPSSVTSIGTMAFCYCTSLNRIEVESGNLYFTTDEAGILYDKEKTKLICCPGAITQKEISIPNGVISIEMGAFSGCVSLTSVRIPVSVTTINWRAFFFDNLKDIYYGGSEEQWKKINISTEENGNDPLMSATIHYNASQEPGGSQKSDQIITAENITKTYGAKAFSLNAKVNTGTALTYVSSNKKVATIDKKGKITIKGCGITNITITAPATDTYNQAQKTILLTVKPKKATLSSVKSTKKKTAAVTWTRNQEASGYLIQCATDSKFKKNKVQVTVSKNKTVSTTVKKLKAGKKYYVRVCAYAKSSKTKVQGNWSKVKTVKVKR